MLQLQRASAGSGKTFTLAKKFIWLFITVKSGNGTRRLRNEKELTDSLSHILAITFTNKATNEMKQRIVEKLAAIAAYAGSGKSPDYLDEFSDLLGVPKNEICHTCAIALKTLLNRFGDFNVSTIDSFFQSVLRTFAYEVDLNDSYQVELDSKYMAQVSIDETLEEIDRRDASDDTYFWLRELMRSFPGKSSQWNVFQKHVPDPSRSGGDTSYSGLLKAIEKLENEEYKFLRPEIEKYFSNGSDFRILYESLKTMFDGRVKNLLDNVKSKARIFVDAWHREGLDLKADGIRSLETSMRKILAYKPSDLPDSGKFTEANIDSPNFCKRKGIDKATLDSLRDLCRDVYEAKHELDDFLSSTNYRHWLVYRRNLPYLGLMKAVAGNRSAFLQDNNLVELSETSSMLRRIIGEDDTPFIYERIGTRLNHFLIDEFQDTSLLQWDNLRPLLSESMSRGNDNLIIGDAKQSIYRFRNADPSIINSRVPREFHDIDIRGMAPADNTNWRSCRRIVEFNNLFFNHLSSRLESLGDSVDFSDLYSNVEQHIHHSEDKGYVEAVFCDNRAALAEKVKQEIGPLIRSIVKRGFSMSDIAVLVARKSEGKAVIDNIIDYNSTLGEEDVPIEFISEESLQLGNSEAVGIIISVLENIARGSAPDVKSESGKPMWSEIKCNFSFFAMQHPGLRTEEQMELFLDGGESYNRLQELLSGMQSVALPSLVEAVAESFVPESLRKSDAAYIAALQDFVLDFCERRDTDIPSFLQTWERKGKDLSISSPEGLDAVQIMTIHKSKGLEFKCVIIPFLRDDYSEKALVRKNEWRWVEPYSFNDSIIMPPYMPVNTDELLKETIHEKKYNDFIDLKRMDFINSEYVAFTRAVEELYIFAECKIDRESISECSIPGIADIPNAAECEKSGFYLYDWLRSKAEEENPGFPVVFELDEEEDAVFTIGKPQISDSSAKDDTEGVIGDYYVNGKIDFLRYKETEGFTEDDEDPDPRSEGNIFHAVMENVRVAEDLPSAVRKLVIKGILSESDADTVESRLAAAFDDPRVSTWFDGSMKFMGERPLLRAGKPLRRPDRIMVDRAGNVVVVDYKFGEVHEDNRYRRQVAEYMDMLRNSGLYNRISGYLWYVREGVVEEISQ